MIRVRKNNEVIGSLKELGVQIRTKDTSNYARPISDLYNGKCFQRDPMAYGIDVEMYNGGFVTSPVVGIAWHDNIIAFITISKSVYSFECETTAEAKKVMEIAAKVQSFNLEWVLKQQKECQEA